MEFLKHIFIIHYESYVFVALIFKNLVPSAG